MLDQKHPAYPNVRLHPERPASGEWVKFKTDSLPDHVHRCPEGYYVGIYQQASLDSYGEPIPESIQPVDEFGDNLFSLPRRITGKRSDIPAHLQVLYHQLGCTNMPNKPCTCDPEKHEEEQHWILDVAFKPIRLDPTKVEELHHLEDRNHLPQHRFAKTIEVDPEYQVPAWHRRKAAEAVAAKLSQG